MNKIIINEKYIKIKTLGSGGQGKAYLVEDIKDNNKYVAKIIQPKLNKDKTIDLGNEETINKKIELFKKINSISSPYLTFFYEGGKAEFVKDGQILKKRNYFIFDYCPFYDLLLIRLCKSFNEKICKLIFKKIALGVQALHNAGIYHRDLKLDNIVIDDNYNPKICDYDLCTEQKGKLLDNYGTYSYMPPQKIEGKEYSAEKHDIFSLGCILFYLMTAGEWFKTAKEDDPLYKYVIENKQNEFFDILEAKYNIIKLSKKDFKDLLFNMISYKEEKRPNINEILNSQWLSELENMNEEMKQQLDNDVKEIIIEAKDYINYKLNSDPLYCQKFAIESTSYKGGKKKNDYKYFKPHLEIKYKDFDIEDLEGEIYIKMIGNFEYWDFMEYFVKEIEEKEKGEVSDYNDGYKCNITFKENENEEDLIIKLKLYKTEDEEYNGEYYDGYLLRFLRISGELYDYYKKVKKISSMGKEILKNHLY